MLHLLEFQFTVHILICHILTEMCGDEIVELLPVDAQRVLGVADAAKKGSARATLYGALAERSWVGETAVVENVVDVEAFDADIDSIKFNAVHGICVDGDIGTETDV